MTAKKKKRLYLANQLRKITHERDILRTRVEMLDVRLKYEGFTMAEQKKLWRLCQKKDFGAMEDHLMYVLSPAAWMTPEELAALQNG
jgi:hypothetical protein